MKVVAPYRKFKYGHISFPEKVRECSSDEIKVIKSIPPAMGEFKDSKGNVLNASKEVKKIKKSKKKSKK